MKAKTNHTAESNYNHLIQTIENIHEKVFIKDEKGKFLVLNSALAIPLGKKVDDLIGTDDFDNFPFDLATEYHEAELNMIEANEPIRLREYMVDSTGKMRYVYSVKVPFFLPDTHKMGILGYQFDITDLKNIESMILEAENRMFEIEELLSLLLLENDGLIEFVREIAYKNCLV